MNFHFTYYLSIYLSVCLSICLSICHHLVMHHLSFTIYLSYVCMDIIYLSIFIFTNKFYGSKTEKTHVQLLNFPVSSWTCNSSYQNLDEPWVEVKAGYILGYDISMQICSSPNFVVRLMDVGYGLMEDKDYYTEIR